MPCYILCGLFLGEQTKVGSPLLGELFIISIIIGGIGGFFVHSLLCIIPIFFQELRKTTNEERSCDIIQIIWNIVAIPFVLLYFILVPVSSLLVITSIFQGILNIPIWFALLNPLVFQILGVILRQICPKYCYDFPSICMGSFGLSMYGVISLVHMI